MRSTFIELLFPRFCLGCGFIGSYICSSCESKIKKGERSSCFYCNRPSLLGLTHPVCKQNLGIDGHLSLYKYDGLFKKILLGSKYKGSHRVLKELLSFPQNNLIKEINNWSALFNPHAISVPLHPQRVKERGFNQSDIIRERYFNLEPLNNEDILQRVVNTEHLANIGSKIKRKKHIKGAFSYVGEKIFKTILLVDDVVTSGATMIECAKILKKSGVQTVLAFSLAKG